MSFNSSLSPNAVKTALDDVFYQGHNYQLMPGYVDATSGAVFIQESTDRSAEIMENFKGSGLWDQIAEEQEITKGNPRVTGQKTFSVVKFAKDIIIPDEYFQDEQHASYEKMTRNHGENARNTRDRNAFAVFRNGFSTALSYDGTALFSDSHVNLGGYTVDNLVSGALSESTLNDAINQLLEMKAQDGVIGGCIPKTLLVPPKLAKLAFEITQSELRSGTANNDLNFYSTKYGIQVAVSQWLGAAAGGSDTAWYLLSDKHTVMRFVRQSLSTYVVEPKYVGNDSWKYGGKFREVVGALSFEGLVGSLGT
jgi:hypothetical protein